MLAAADVAVVLQNPVGGGRQGSALDQGLRTTPTLLVRPLPQPNRAAISADGRGTEETDPSPGWRTSPCPLHEGHSHSRHPLILEGDEGHVKPLECDAVALSIELIRELLLQLPIVLLCVHLREQPGLCCARRAEAWASCHALPCPRWGCAACSPARTLLPAQSHRSGSRRYGHRGGF